MFSTNNLAKASKFSFAANTRTLTQASLPQRYYSDAIKNSKRNTGGCYNYGIGVVVGQEYAVMLHRFEKFAHQLEPGWNFKIPFIDKVAYVHDLRE